MKQIELKDLSIIELKAYAYDTLAQIQSLQGNLDALNNEIHVRVNQPVKTEGSSELRAV